MKTKTPILAAFLALVLSSLLAACAHQGTNSVSKSDENQIQVTQSDVAKLYDLENDYADFFKKYPMSAEKKNLIYVALFKWQDDWNNFMQHYMDPRKQNETRLPFDRQTTNAESEKLKQQFAVDLKKSASLQDNVIEALLYYKSTLPQREFANMIAEQMSAAGCALTADQFDRLVDVFRLHYIAQIRASDAARTPGIAELAAKGFARNERTAMVEAAKILTPKQMDILKQIWASVSSQLNDASAA